jgi:hypothetical protein
MDKQKVLIAICLFLTWAVVYQSNKCSTIEEESLGLKMSFDSLRIKYEVLNSELNAEKMMNMRYEYALDILETSDPVAAYKYKVVLIDKTE